MKCIGTFFRYRGTSQYLSIPITLLEDLPQLQNEDLLIAVLNVLYISGKSMISNGTPANWRRMVLLSVITDAMIPLSIGYLLHNIDSQSSE